jgi:hypothetical protein
MNDIVTMQILNSCAYLMKQKSALAHQQWLSLTEIEKVTETSVLSDENIFGGSYIRILISTI